MRQKFVCVAVFQVWCALVLALGWWLLAAAQQPALSPQEQLAQCQWDVRQLKAGREQAEKNVSYLGAQVEKLQAELEQLRAQIPKEKAE